MNLLRLDFEVRSEAELSGMLSVGLHNYATHPTTKPLLLAYKFSGEDVELWQFHEHLERLPKRLEDAFADPNQMLSAFNSQFERYILQYQLGILVPAERFQDPQVSARYLSMPGSLEEVGQILGLPYELAKDKLGSQLIDLFCKPKKRSLGRGKGYTIYFNDWESHPKEFAKFGEYCKKDVIAEEEVARREQILQAFPLPLTERKLWILDQKINDRGIPVDVPFVQSMYKLATKAKQEALDRQNKITGLENANSRAQLLPWLQERGYPHNTLKKDGVKVLLKDPESKLTDEAREVLLAREEAASTSFQKLAAILRTVSSDGRLRNLFIFMGSSRCGRWAGTQTQIHNFPRADETFEDQDNVNKARAMVYAEDHKGLKKGFIDSKTQKPIPILLIIKSLLRTVFCANPIPAIIEEQEL